MRTLRTLLVASIVALMLGAAPAGATHSTEQAQQLVDETLGSLPLPESELLPEAGGGAGGHGGTDGTGIGTGVLAAVTYLGHAAQAAAEGVVGLGLGLVAGIFALFAEGGQTAASAAQAVVAQPVQSAGIATLVALAVGGGLGLLGLFQRYGSLGAIPLFSRIAKSELLENGMRAEIYELIRQVPGINVSEISRRLGVAWGTVTHHLQKLRAERLVAIRQVSNQKCYFINGGTYTPSEMDVMSATKNATAKRIAQFLVAHGPAAHQDIALTLEVSPALVSFHMRKLVDAGVVARQRQGRRTIFSPMTAVLEPAPRALTH